jgi:hypothetical protein
MPEGILSPEVVEADLYPALSSAPRLVMGELQASGRIGAGPATGV